MKGYPVKSARPGTSLSQFNLLRSKRTVPLEDFFASTFDLEESVRVDRRAAGDGGAERLRLLESYHVTESAEDYLRDILARILGETEGDRKGFNHWLYGYYGSGKSHLLAVTGLLLDSTWIGDIGRNRAWRALTGGGEALTDLRVLWERCLDEYKLHPLFANLLKEQGNRQRGFGNVILRRLHEEQGRSPHLKTAFFEEWYLESHSEEELRANAEEVLREVAGDLPGENLWSQVQKYQVLAEGALPVLFEKETGTRDGFSDVVNRSLDASTVAERIEQARQDLESDSDCPVRLLLLLDEITLFIGTQYGLLTELNALAEAIDEEGGGNILTVGTAQEDPSRVQTEYAAREVDFSILDDRFPHQYSLPSSHVGEIVRNRLLRKTERGRDAFDLATSEANLKPSNSLVFCDVQKNTDPPLDHLPEEEVRAYLPLLPYHPPLFLDILSNLRTEEADRAKSIFSGTARAVLAIVNGLLELWDAAEDGDLGGKDGDPTRIVSLVDFFEVIRPELEDIVPQEVQTIEEVESRARDGELEPIDAKVCKVVLLLQRVPDMIPLDDAKNIAVGLMDDLNGNTLHRMANAVDESLGRLGKYIRTDDEDPSQLRFTDREERAVLDAAEEKEARFGPSDIVEEMTTQSSVFGTPGSASLWDEVLRHLDLPKRVPYTEGGDRYPVQYTFDVDRHQFASDFGEDGALHVRVHVEGLVSSEERPQTEHSGAFLWKLPADGQEPLYESLREWAALSAACREHRTPSTIEQSLRRRSEDLPSRIGARIRNGTLKVPMSEPNSVSDGVTQHVRTTTPSSFHPEMRLVDEARLRELEGIRWTSNLPPWAEKIGVVCDNQTELVGDVVTTVRGIVGRALRQDETLSVTNALERLRKKEDAYEDVGPALVAHLWGLSKEGSFQPISEDGNPLRAEKLLDPTRWHEVRLRIGQDNSLRGPLEKIPDIDSSDTMNEAIVKARSFIEAQRRRADTLFQQIGAAQEDTATEPVQQLLGGLSDWLSQRRDQIQRWLDKTQDQHPNWESVIEGALSMQDQIEGAAGQWDTRESFLLQLDALLLFYEKHEEDLSEEAAEDLSTLHQETRAATSILWWTEGGWAELVNALGHRTSAIQALGDWWKELRQDEDRARVMEKTKNQPWLAPPKEPSLSHVGRKFRTDILGTLRGFRQAMERAEGIIDPLTEEPHKVDPADLRRTLGRLQRGGYLDLPAVKGTETPLQKLQLLEAITGGAAPGEVGAVGYWPKDANHLKSALQRLVRDEDDYKLKDTEHGVIITPRP